MNLIEFCSKVKPIKLSVTKDTEELHYKDLIFQETKFLNVYSTVPISLRYYCIFNNIKEIPKCLCGNIVTYKKDDPSKGFGKFCGPNCSRKNKDHDKEFNKFLNDKEWLFHQRITLNKSKELIAKELNCSTTVITDRLEKFNIEKRLDNIRNTKIDVPPKNDLENLYFTKQLTLMDIGKYYDISNTTVKKWFKHYGIIMYPVYDKWIANTFIKYNLDIEKFSNHDFLKTIINKSSYSKLSETHFNGMPEMTIIRHFKRIGFDPDFGKNNSSIGELEIGDYIKSLGFNIINRDKQLIKPFELDILITDHNLAIEFNGLYYHSNDKYKHLNKLNKCLEKNITLIQIFEDEWYFKKSIIKSIIKNHLGCIDTKIYARDTVFKKITSDIAYKFIEENHIQGFVGAENYYALFYNEELVSVISIGKCRFIKNAKEIIRYCNKINLSIVGGFSKLLKYIKKDYNEIYTYSNLRFFDGRVYEKYGKFIKQTEPGYYWTHKSKCIRLSRYQTQKHKLYELLKDNYDPNLTEEQNMENNKYVKIWDCGHKLYLL